MNVLIITADYYAQIGGKFTHILMLKKGLEELGNSVEILHPRRNFVNKLFIGGPGKLLDIFGVGVYYRQYVIKEMLKCLVEKRLHSSAVEVMNAEDIIAFWAVSEIKNRPRVILTVHGELAQEMESAGHTKRAFEKDLFLRLEKKAYENADYVIAVDTRLKEHIKGLAPKTEHKLSVIKNFIDVNSFNGKVLSLKREEVLKKFNIALIKNVVLVPRRLMLKCGVIYAIKAAETIAKKLRRRDFVFLIVGDGPEKMSLASYINDNKLGEYIKMFNGVMYDEMAKFYRVADIVLVPSIDVKGYKEATSLSVLEAMATRIPVIASGLGGLAEIIENGKTGILVPEKSHQEIASNIIRVIDDDRLKSSLTDAAFDYVSRNHSHLSAAKKFLEIYKK